MIAHGDPRTDAPTVVHAGATPNALPAGTVVGRYVVIEHVGAGGLGDVHSAYDPQLDRKVAIKLLRPDPEARRAFGDPTDRLLREAQAMARVRHPHAVAVHDVGLHREQVFVAMEFVAGPTLHAWTRDGSRSWQEVRDVFLQAGRGLVAAHEAGLVHRDFKLSNVIVEQRGTEWRAVVLDFGLAKAFDGTPTVDGDPPTPPSGKTSLLERDMTRVGYLAGTPPYMAPELFAGGAGTPASDQFAFCVALWSALYGELPFEGPTVEEHLRAIEAGPPAPKATRVPPWLHRVIVRGLAVKPRDRFPDMLALLDALVEDRRRRRRGLLALAFALPLAGAAAVAIPIALQPPMTQADLERSERLAGEARAAAARGYYVHPPVDAPDGPTAFRKIIELEREEGPEALRVASDLRAEMSETLVRLGDEYWEREGGAPFAIDFYAAALLFTPDHEHAAARASLSLGQLADLRGKAESGAFSASELAAAEPLAVLADGDRYSRTEKVRALYRRRSGTAASTRARLEALLDPGERDVASASEREGQQVVAQASTRTASPASATDDEPSIVAPGDAKTAAAPTAGDAATAAREVKAGQLALKKGELADAESRFHRALEARRNDADALAGLAQIRFERGDYDKAVRFATRAADAAPRSARIRILLGDAHFKVLAYDAARRAYERAQELGSSVADERLARLDKLTSKPK